MIEEGLVTFLLADTAIAARISNRMHAVKLPQKPVLPALVYTRISSNRGYHSEGQDSLASPRFQLDCWDPDVKGSRELAADVRKRLSGHKGAAGSETIQGAFLADDNDLYDFELDAHRVQMDFIVWHDEALT